MRWKWIGYRNPTVRYLAFIRRMICLRLEEAELEVGARDISCVVVHPILRYLIRNVAVVTDVG